MLNTIMQNLTTILLIGIIILLVLILFLMIFCIIKPMKKRINDISLEMFIVMKKQQLLDNSMDEVKHAMNVLNHNIGSLSSSTTKGFEDIKEFINNDKIEKYTKRHLPTPDLAQKMRDTILENINIEVLMAEQMRIPDKAALRHIIDNTIKTYPDIEYEYTIKLVVAMVQNFIESVSNKKNE